MLRRIGLVLVLLLLLAFAALVLTLRYSILPNIDQYHADIAALASRALGQAIEIGKIEAGWEGVGPYLNLSGIRVLDAQKRTTIALQSVHAEVSWQSLLSGELRLSSLEINEPDLLVKRDAQGKIHISGVSVDNTSTDSNSADLLLSQSRIMVRNAHISWLDEMRSSPMLTFDDVNLLIENRWSRHRFSMQARPPKELSSGLDVRGELYGSNFEEIAGWHGEIYTKLDYADIAAWRNWLPLPAYFRQGRGALRGWLGIEQGKPVSLTTDVALLNVQTRLDPDLPVLNIKTLNGKLGWRFVENGFAVSMKQTTLELQDGFVLKPTDASLRLENLQTPEKLGGEFSASLLELEGLSRLLDYIPLDKKIRAGFMHYAPRGNISNAWLQWQQRDGQPLQYQVKARFANLALQRVEDIPGFAGLSGEVDGSESKGSISLDSRNVAVDAPRWMQSALALDSLTAQAGWQSNGKGLEIRLRNLALVNDDVSARAYGSYQTLKDSPGVLDLNVQMTHVAVPKVARYIPLLALGHETRSWLNLSLLQGVSNDASVRIRGDLNDFPFAGSRKGLFRVHARATDVALEFDPAWPKIEHASAEFSIQGREISIQAAAATTLGNRLQNVRVEIPDMMADDPVMTIHGEAQAENRRALEYVQKSPIRGYLNGFTDSIKATGQGKLGLNLYYPFRADLPVKISGNYHFTDSEVEIDPQLPTLRRVNGDLQFTEYGASTKNIEAQVLGGPAKLLMDSKQDGSMNIRLHGRTDLAALRKANPLPVLERVSGNPGWNLEIAVQNKLSRIVLNSDMQGLQSALPAPLAKQAAEAIPLLVEIKDTAVDARSIKIQYGALLNAHLLQEKDEDNDWWIERGLVNFGNVAHQADRKGLWVIGTLPQVSLEGWGALSGLAAEKDDSPALELAGADFTIQKLTGFGSRINDLHVKAGMRSDMLVAQLASREINGEVNWQPSSETVGGRWYAKLKNLEWGLDNDEDKSPGQYTATKPSQVNTTDLPTLEMSIEKLIFKGRQLGRLELQTQQKPSEYLLNRLRLTNPDGVLNVDGKWNKSGSVEETRVNVKMDIANAGNVLARSGYPNTIKGGSGKMDAVLSWPNAPWLYDKEQLSGSLKIDTGSGQFLQIDPGAGKLLSILSLQALPKRIALDFDDVFSKGFEFDSIAGNASIKEGVMSTDNLKIEGSAAKVFMAGTVNLKTEQQDMRVHIVPTVGNSAALISALVATPVVGAGVYLASKILNDPLGQLVSFEYNISGSWTEPKVEKVEDKNKSTKSK